MSDNSLFFRFPPSLGLLFFFWFKANTGAVKGCCSFLACNVSVMFFIYLTWESHMCRVPDSFVSFYFTYFYMYRVLFTYFFDLLFSKTRQHLRCNLLFGLIGHFGLLQYVNIFFFLLSFFLQWWVYGDFFSLNGFCHSFSPCLCNVILFAIMPFLRFCG